MFFLFGNCFSEYKYRNLYKLINFPIFVKMNDETSIDELFIFIKGRWYPNDDNMRARSVRGHSRSCPMPVILATTIVTNRRVVDLDLRQDPSKTYCWESCDITDCPAYQANR